MFEKVKFLFFFTVALLFLSVPAAQAAELGFTLSGNVRDAKTSNPVIGAIVRIKDSDKGTVTNVNGDWVITGVVPGRQTLVFSFMSYKTVERVIDVQGDTGGNDIMLEEDATQLGEVVVKSVMRSDTENSMVGTVKLARQVVSGISAAQIAKSPDRTASEVVRRVPGITIIDERFVIVRGLAQRYNNAWLNGLAVPSTETDSRAFSFDMIPGSQIDNLLVYKSPSPEIPGDFSGGFVKIFTKGVPDKNSTEIGYQTGFNVNTQFDDFRINLGSGTDFLGFDVSKRPIDKSFPAHMRTVTDNPALVSQLTKTAFNNDWRIKNIKPIPDQRLTLLLARRIETEKGKIIGNITTLTYSNTYKTTEGIKNARYGTYSVSADKPSYDNDYTDNQYSHDVRIGMMHNWTFMPNSNNRYEFKNLFNLLGRNRLTERSGTSEVSGTYYREDTEMLYSSRLTYTGQFSGTHDLKNRGTLSWDAGYSYADRNEPDRRIAEYIRPLNSENTATYIEHIKRYYQTLHDNIVSVAANYKQPLRWGAIEPELRTGIYGEYRMRDYTPREFDYKYGDNLFAQYPDYVYLPLQQAMDPKYLGADMAYIYEMTNKSYAYTADVYHAAAYGALSIPVGKLDIYAGVRLESYTTKLTSDRIGDGYIDEKLMATQTTEDLNLLPSINMTWKFNKLHQLRAAYGRSVNRPELRELADTKYYDFDLFSFIEGNPDLKTALIDNADIRYEFYPASGETVSLGAFYKHFSNPIEWTVSDPGGSGRLEYKYENADKAVSWGFELDVRKKLDFIDLPNFSLVLNAAWIESNVEFGKADRLVAEADRPMQGQSPYIINAGLFYGSEKLGLDMALLYNRIGRRIIGVGIASPDNPDPTYVTPDSYEMPRNSLDFSISKKIGKLVDIRASIKDILSEDIVYKQFPKFLKEGAIQEREQTTRKYNPGQSVSVGITIKL